VYFQEAPVNEGRIVFSQVVELLPRRAFENAVKRHGGQNRVRSFSCMDQLLCMIFAQLTGRASLRETVTCLRAIGPRRYHCGIRGPVSRSTLADANEQRDHRIFMDTALAMIAATRLELPVNADLARLNTNVYAIDSTTIDLCLKLFPWARFRRRKGGIKAHTMFDLLTEIPVFMRVSHAKTHDLWMLDQITPQPGAFYVMDRGYIDFARLYRLHAAAAFFVTRTRSDMDYRVLERRNVDSAIALLYHKRWRIELFFKWIKQHLHIKAFFGTTPNAVKTKLWVAVIVYVLTVKLKHRYQLPQDLNKVLQILSVTILEKTPIYQLFSDVQPTNATNEFRNQLMLFDI
jgi:hypothetical protein